MPRIADVHYEKLACERKLEHIDIEITKKCNLSCVHCSAQSNIVGKELSLNEIRLILDEADSLGLENVGFTGGEPLICRKKLLTLLEHCRDVLNSKTHLHSNGTLFESKDATRIAELVDEITITVLGSNPNTHDGLTLTEGSLKATEKGLERLLHEQANVRVFIVPMKPNFREVPQIIKKVHETGCNKIRILSLSPTGRARNSFEALSLDSRELEWLSNELVRTQKELGVNIEAGFCTQQDYPHLGKLRGHQTCLAAENRVHIDALGEVFPCTASSGLQQFSAGNLRKYRLNLSDIWKFSPIFQLLRFFHSNPPDKCKSCTSYDQCMGGCRIMMYHKYGDATATKSGCKSE